MNKIPTVFKTTIIEGSNKDFPLTNLYYEISEDAVKKVIAEVTEHVGEVKHIQLNPEGELFNKVVSGAKAE